MDRYGRASLLVIALFLVVPLALGVYQPSLWTFLAGPAVAAIIGGILVLSEHPNFDQHGFGWWFALFLAALSVIAWTLGWAFGLAVRWVKRAPHEKRGRA